MKTITFNHRESSIIGMGTWRYGEGDLLKTQREIEILKQGLNHGINVIDTAEMYGNGKAEKVVGQAIQNFDRDKFQIISKFYPYHATPELIKESLEKSLKRLNTDYLDVYLLHWRGQTPLAETVEGLEAVKKAGLIKSWGVSNFSTDDMKELASVPNGENCQVNEDLYNLTSRGVEYSLLPYQKERNIDFIGYSPFGSDNNAFLNLKGEVGEVAASKGVSIFQLLLAWCIRSGNVLSIPKASSIEHFAANLEAADITFTNDEIEALDKIYPAPTHETPLESI